MKNEYHAQCQVEQVSQAGQVRPESVRRVRLGHGANCSSIGSVVDTLFATAVAGTALFAAVVAALSKESVNVPAGDEHRLDADRPAGGST